MKALSAKAQQIIDQCIEDYTRPLSVILDDDFIVKSWSGDSSYYGFEALREGTDCRDSFLFLTGLNARESIQLRFVETPNGRAVDVDMIYQAGEIIIVMLDTTEQRINHAAIQQKGNELALLQIEQAKLIKNLKRLEKEVEAKHRLAEKANRLKGQFIATMSHEFRTPLTSILGYSSRLKKKYGNDSKSRKYLGSVEKGAQHLLSLVENLLDYSQIEVDSLAINPIATNVSVVLDKLFSIFEPLAEDKQLELRFKIDTGIPDYLLLDEMRFRQIMVNLISNAIKFTEQGLINVQVKYAREELVAIVEDTGKGIAKCDQDRVFGAFERLGKQPGAGLGLSIVKHLATAMGGKLLLESMLGKGSRFELLLPAKKTDINPKITHQEHSYKKHKKKRPLKKVLIVEDDPDIMVLLQDFFQDEDCCTMLADNGEQAIYMAMSEQPDLVILDLNLPDISGFDLLRVLRQNNFVNPVFVQSAWVSTDYKARAFASGADEYLLKPLDIEHWNKLISDYFYNEQDPGMPLVRYQQLCLQYRAALPEKLEKLKQLELENIKQNWGKSTRQELHFFVHKLSGSAGLYKMPLIGESSKQLDELFIEYDSAEPNPFLLELQGKITTQIALLAKQIDEIFDKR